MPPERDTKAAILDGGYSFTVRPEPVPGDLRMAWGMAITLLILAHSRGKRATFQKLQLGAHSVRTREGRDDLRSLLAGRLRSHEISVRVEPWVNRAVTFAHAQGLVEVDGGRVVHLTPQGEALASSIPVATSALAEEATFLAEVVPKLTEARITKIWRMEDLV